MGGLFTWGCMCVFASLTILQERGGDSGSKPKVTQTGGKYVRDHRRRYWDALATRLGPGNLLIGAGVPICPAVGWRESSESSERGKNHRRSCPPPAPVSPGPPLALLPGTMVNGKGPWD